MDAVLTKTYAAPPIDEREILRYAGCKDADERLTSLLADCLEEAKDKFVYKVCYAEYALRTEEDTCLFGPFRLYSKGLTRVLTGAERVVTFAVTVGVEIDRLIAKYGRLSPVRALLFQAIGTERIEALCDVFCADLKNENAFVTSRFSAGYGDLPLETQRQIFAALDCSKRIGACLNESLLVSPSKSVTAFVGLSKEGKCVQEKEQCGACSKWDCAFRKKD